MALKFNSNYARGFIDEKDFTDISQEIISAHNKLETKSGAGSDYLGWMDLPENYDKKEFELIKDSAEKIKKDSDVLVVIGIGGSYLGARAVIEFCK